MDTRVTKPLSYAPPHLVRWGTIRELTQGGGGFKNEPGPGNQNTRF
jgi:hypothetical protein